MQLAIELYNLCEQFHTLPRAGGILDQDWYHIKLLQAVSRAARLKEARDLEAAKNNR